MADLIVKWCNAVNPQPENEDMIIRYGAELLIDNLARLLLILCLGVLLGKGYETVIILLAFCGIRSQAGGIHAKTGFGCGVSMSGICLLSLLGGSIVDILDGSILILYLIFVGITWIFVPQTVNREYYTEKMIRRKKCTTLFLINCFCIVAHVMTEVRGFIMWALMLEMGTVVLGWWKQKRES